MALTNTNTNLRPTFTAQQAFNILKGARSRNYDLLKKHYNSEVEFVYNNQQGVTVQQAFDMFGTDAKNACLASAKTLALLNEIETADGLELTPSPVPAGATIAFADDGKVTYTAPAN